MPRPRGRVTFPTSGSVGNVVADVLARWMLPIDENAVYAVLGDESTTQVRDGGKHSEVAVSEFLGEVGEC